MAFQGESKDVQLFRAVCYTTFEKIAQNMSQDRLIELLRPFVGSTSKRQKIYELFQRRLIDGLKERVDVMIEDEQLGKKFALRAELLEQQKEFEGTIAWRPSGDPNQDQRSHDMQELLKVKAEMQEYLAEKETYVNALMEKVRKDRQDTAELQSTICGKLNNIAEANSVLDEFEECSSKVLKALAPMSEDYKDN